MSTGQMWQVSADGGFLANPILSQTIRRAAQPLFRFMQFARMEPGYGKGKSDTLNFNKISNVLSPASTAGLQEDQVMPETKFQIRRGTLLVTEYGNSIPYTQKLEALSQYDPNNEVTVALRNDEAKLMDTIAALYMKQSGVTYTPTGTSGSPTNTITAGSNSAATASRNLQVSDVQAIRDYMVSTLKVPPYDGENYICVGSTFALRGIKNDQYFVNAALYGDPDRLFNGEIGKLEGIRFIETNNTLALSTFQSATCGEALFFGEDPLILGTVIAPEIRAKIPTDYGRSRGVAWYFLGGWQCPWKFATDTEARIVWVSDGSNLPPAVI